jgi:hypothetical protein
MGFALAVIALAAGLVPGGAPSAGASPSSNASVAAPPLCPDGSPPPCGDDPDPEPTPTTERPPRTTTTRPGGTTTSTIPAPGPPWEVRVLNLDQDDEGTIGLLTAERWHIFDQVFTPGSAQAGTSATLPQPLPDIEASRVLVGSSVMQGNRFQLPGGQSLPAHASVQLRVLEQDAPGVLCRTPKRSPLPASGVQLHILEAPAVSKDADDLSAMVSSFGGPVAGLPSNVSVDIASASLSPQADGLGLRLQGALTVNEWDFDFDFRLRLTLVPQTGLNTAQVLSVDAPDPGTADLTWVGTPPPDGDALIAFLKPQVETTMRDKVLAQARPLVNTNLVDSHDVRWWTEQGFTISIRRVVYSAADVKVYAGLCRLG